MISTRTIGTTLRKNYRHGSIELVPDSLVLAGIAAAMIGLAALYVTCSDAALGELIKWWRW